MMSAEKLLNVSLLRGLSRDGTHQSIRSMACRQPSPARQPAEKPSHDGRIRIQPVRDARCRRRLPVGDHLHGIVKTLPVPGLPLVNGRRRRIRSSSQPQ